MRTSRFSEAQIIAVLREQEAGGATAEVKPQQNGFVESFNGKLRDECLNEEVFPTLAEARAVIEAWRQDYNQVRPHSALGGLTPESVRLKPRPNGCATWKAPPPGRSPP